LSAFSAFSFVTILFLIFYKRFLLSCWVCFYLSFIPGSELIARSTTDFSQKIPVYVITSIASGGGEEENRYYKEVAVYYGITPERVKQLIDEARDKHDSATYWM